MNSNLTKPHALLLALPFLVFAQSPTYTISGRLILHSNNHPLARTKVTIQSVERPAQQFSELTNSDGDFIFSTLFPGKYSLSAEYRGVNQYFGHDDNYWIGIAAGPGQDTQHIVFPVESPAAINGRILDQDGDPVPSANIYLFERCVTQGLRQTCLRAQASTIQDGSFHLGHLSAGAYYLAAVGRPWYAPQSPARILTPNGIKRTTPPTDLDFAFPLTYYAGSTSANGATPIQLEEGGHQEIETTLHALPAVHIKFDPPPDSNAPLGPIEISQRAIGDFSNLVSYTLMDNELTGFAPGDYQVSETVQGGKRLSAFISPTGNETIHLNELSPSSVTGKLVLTADMPPNFAVFFRNLESGKEVPIWISPDDSLQLGQPLPPGRYTVLPEDTPDFFIQSLTVKGVPYSNGELQISAGAQIDLKITVGRGSLNINGRVIRGDKPLAGAMVLAFPQDLSHGRFILRDQSDSDGTFSLRGAPPGRYQLLAIDNGHDLEYANPAVIAPYLAAARIIDVALANKTQVEIPAQPRQ